MPGRKKYAPPLTVVKAGNPVIFFPDGTPRYFEFQRAVLMADDQEVAFVAELVKISIVRPDVLRELELADQARADRERRDAALLSVLGRAFGQREDRRRRLRRIMRRRFAFAAVSRGFIRRMCAP